jgi:putative hemolysin
MVYIEIAVVLMLTLVNGVFAMSELAVVSSRRSRLEFMADSSRGARIALELIEDPSRFLSTVQIGITLVGVLAGAFGGVTLASRLGHWLEGFSAIAPYGSPLAMVLVVTAITYLSLISRANWYQSGLRWPIRSEWRQLSHL